MASTDPTILSFDTSGPYCAVALSGGATVVRSSVQDMARGQAERLIPLIEAVMSDASVTWSDIEAIGVGTGPGNFTGIRISVATARGLALALGVPAYGVDGFDQRTVLQSSAALCCIPAPRDQLYVRQGPHETRLMSLDEARTFGKPILGDPNPGDLVAAIAWHAHARYPGPAPAPAPLYVKPADAAPSRDAAPIILDADV